MDLSNISKTNQDNNLNNRLNKTDLSNMMNQTDNNQSKRYDNSKQFLREATAKHSIIELSEMNKSKDKDKERTRMFSKDKKQKFFEDSNLCKPRKKKKLKFKQPFIEYVNIESFKTLNSMMCFSDPHMENKTKRCKCNIL